FRVGHVGPCLPALLTEPGVQFVQILPAPLARVLPNLATPILHVLLDTPLLPAGGPVTEIRLEQVMAAHGKEARIDVARLAPTDLVDGRLHIVVDAAPRHAAKGSKGARMRVEQHLVALRRVRSEPEGAARTQLGVRNIELSAQTADEGVLRAPVELEGFAQRKAQRHVRGARLARFLRSPALDERAHPVVAARVALRADRLEHRPRRAPIALWPMPVRPEPLPELLCPRIDDASGLEPLVLRLDNILVPQPVANGVPGKPGDRKSVV